jgi:hypothetical protein
MMCITQIPLSLVQTSVRKIKALGQPVLTLPFQGAGTPICIPYPPTTTAPSCKSTYWSVLGDTCQSIASQFGYYDYQISDANSFLDCNDICKPL